MQPLLNVACVQAENTLVLLEPKLSSFVDFTISVINSFERVLNLMASLQNLIISHILVNLQHYFLIELKKMQKFYIL